MLFLLSLEEEYWIYTSQKVVILMSEVLQLSPNLECLLDLLLFHLTFSYVKIKQEIDQDIRAERDI